MIAFALPQCNLGKSNAYYFRRRCPRLRRRVCSPPRKSRLRRCPGSPVADRRCFFPRSRPASGVAVDPRYRGRDGVGQSRRPSLEAANRSGQGPQAQREVSRSRLYSHPTPARPPRNSRLAPAVPALHRRRRLSLGPRWHPSEKGLTRHPPRRIPEDPHLAALQRSRQPALARFLRAGASPARLWPRRARRLGAQKARWPPLSPRPRLGLHLRRPTQRLCA